jgi:hypothetical protein
MRRSGVVEGPEIPVHGSGSTRLRVCSVQLQSLPCPEVPFLPLYQELVLFKLYLYSVRVPVLIAMYDELPRDSKERYIVAVRRGVRYSDKL